MAAYAQSAPYKLDPKFVAAMTDAKKATSHGQPEFAIEAYKKADKIAGGTCGTCLNGVIDLQMEMGAYKEAAASASQLATIASSSMEKSRAEATRGLALYKLGGEKPRPSQLEAANEALKAAIADYPNNLSARFTDGTVLARMGKIDAAREQFELCVAGSSPDDLLYLRAKRFVGNPALSYAKRAPTLTLEALDGSKFALDEMNGRVVLIDFWATWCPGCIEELPQLKRIAQDFAGEPFVIVSVNSATDEIKAWKDFVAKNQMNWVQYHDTSHRLAKALGVETIPRYFTIDSEGMLTAEILGANNQIEGKLKKLVAKAKIAQVAISVPDASISVAAMGN